MNATEESFRKTRIDLLEFYGSPSAQLKFASDVPRYDGYAYDEFISWWCDDFHPQDNMFKNSFTANELQALVKFNFVLEAANCFLEKTEPSVSELLDTKHWQMVIESANETFSQLSINL